MRRNKLFELGNQEVERIEHKFQSLRTIFIVTLFFDKTRLKYTDEENYKLREDASLEHKITEQCFLIGFNKEINLTVLHSYMSFLLSRQRRDDAINNMLKFIS